MKPVNCSSRAGSTRVRVLAFCLAVLTVMMTCTVVVPVSAEDSYPANYTNVKTDDNGVRYAYDTDAEIWLAVGLDDDCNLHAVVAASTPDGYPVEAIADNAFAGTDIVSLTIPDTVKHIGTNALKCPRLQHIVIGSGLETLDEDALADTDAAFIEYDGTVAQWRTISKDRDWSVGVETVIICTDGYLDNYDTQIHPDSELTYKYEYGFATVTGVTDPHNPAVVIPSKTPDGVPILALGYECFMGHEDIKQVFISEGVDYLAGWNFCGCTNLAAVILPDSLTGLGGNTFNACEKLKTIDIPAGVTRLLPYVFCYSGITKMDIPDTITSIGEGAFYWCDLQKVSIPASVTSIGDEAFVHCSSLELITVDAANARYTSSGSCLVDTQTNRLLVGTSNPVIPADGSVKTIAKHAFWYNNNLTDLYLPATIQTIESEGIMWCGGLKTLTLPDSLLTIGESGISCNEGLTALYIPASVTTVGEGAVSGDKNVTLYCESAYAGAGWATKWNPFNYPIRWNSEFEHIGGFSSGLKYTKLSATTCSVVGAGTFKGKYLSIPETSPDGLTVVSVGANAFSNNAVIESVHIPDTVKTLDYGAFINCDFLKRVDMGNGVTIVQNGAFYECPELETVTFSSALTTLGNNVFMNDVKLTAANLPDSLHEIPQDSFSGCSSLSELVLPSKLTTIGNNAFHGTAITSVTIPKTVTTMNGGCFSNCPNIVSLSVEEGNSSFYSVDNCIISNTTHGVVLGCKNSIIPADGSVTRIDYCAFFGSSIESIDIPDCLDYIGEYAFRDCLSLTSVDLPSSLTQLDNWVFSGCEKLTSLTLPQKLKYIGLGCFGNSRLTSIRYPSTVIRIPDNATVGCNSLAVITADEKYDHSNPYYSDGNCLIERSTGTIISGCCASVIPEDEKVTAIGYNAFSQLDGLQSIDIPDNITSIGFNAFAYSGLKSIELPDSITDIAEDAFTHCSCLSEMKLPSNLNAISDWMLTECGFETIDFIPSSVKSIGSSSLRGNPNLTTIVIPEGVETIDAYAFNENDTLKTVYFPSTLTSIAKNVFDSCGSLETVYYNSTWADWQTVTNGGLQKEWWNYTGDYDIVCTDGKYTFDGTLVEAYEDEPEEFTYPETVEKLDDSGLTLTESGNKILIDVDVDALDFEHYIYYLSLEVLDYNDIVYVKQANTEYLLNETQYTGLLTDGLIQVTADFTGTDMDMTVADYDHLLVTLYATRTVDYETHIYGMAWDSLGYVGSKSFDFPTTVERLSDGFLTMSQPAGGSVILIVPDFSKFDFEHYDYYYKAFGYNTSELASVCAELEECIGSGIGAYVIDTGDFYALTLNTTVFASSAESADENQIMALVIGVAKDLTGVCEAYQLGWNSREYYNPEWEIESETETESATEPETEPVIEHPETEYRFYHGETVVTVEPDCTNPGTSMTPLYRDTVDKVTGEVYSTYFCGYTYEMIPALGHDYTSSILDGPLSCTKDTPYHYSCSRCEEIFYDTIPAPGHTLSDWEPYVDATYTSTGVERRHCMYCDYSEDRIVPILSMPSFSLGINGRVLTRGATFTVPVTLKTNPGVITTKFSVVYPSAFTLEKVEDAELLKGFIQPSPDVHSPYTLLWKDSLSTTNNTATGTVVFLTFKVKDDAAIGEYEFAVIPAEARNASGAAITLNNVYETVTVSDAIIGDTDGDGEVSDWDGVILDRYLAGWDIGDIDMTAFDIDGDGEVTDWDGVLMDRWLAGWDVECNIISN